MQNNGYIQNCTEELSAQSLNTVFLHTQTSMVSTLTLYSHVVFSCTDW